MITYQEEFIGYGLASEMIPLAADHLDEVSHIDGLEFKPDPMAYMRACLAGRCKAYTVRNEDKLLGYLVYSIEPMLNFGDKLVAKQELLYIIPEKRKGMLGVKLIKFSEKMLKELGVNIIVQHTTVKNDVSSLFKRLGYKECDILLSKEI